MEKTKPKGNQSGDKMPKKDQDQKNGSSSSKKNKQKPSKKGDKKPAKKS